MSVHLKTYLGTPISVSEKGQFMAWIKVWGSDSREEMISNRDLREIEKAIEQSRPTEAADFRPIEAMSVQTNLEFAHEPRRVTVAGARRENVGRGRNAQVSEYLVDEEGKQIHGWHSLYDYDPEAVREFVAILAAEEALKERWTRAVAGLTKIDAQAVIEATVKTVK